MTALWMFLSVTCHAQTTWTIIDLGALPGDVGSEANSINDEGQVVGTSYSSEGAPRAFLWSSGLGMQALPDSANGAFAIGAWGINNNGQVVGHASGQGINAQGFVWSGGSAIQLLGVLPGGASSAALGINDSGQIVGYSGTATGSNVVSWTSGGGMQDLGNMPGATNSEGWDINNNGLIVGRAFIPGKWHAFLLGSGFQDLGTLGGIEDRAHGINSSGEVVGCSYTSPGIHAFLWSGAMQDLGSGCALGINDNAQVVGWSEFGAFLWTSGSGMQNLSALPEVIAAGWHALSEARAINNAGQIAGVGQINGRLRAFLLSPSGGPSPKTAGSCPSAGQSTGDDPNKPEPCPLGNPINPFTGNKYQIETDYVGAGTYPLRFERYYNSNAGIGSGRIGAKWRHTFDRFISVQGTSAQVFRPDGKQFVFTQSGADWVGPVDVMDRLAQTASGWTYTSAPDDEVETYDASGRLISIANRAGVAHTMGYDGSARLATVTHSLGGKTLTISYETADRIASMTDPAGKVFSYAYDATGNLVSVTFPDDTESTTDNPVRAYVYNEPANTSGANLPTHLTGIIDESGNRFTTYQYAADGRAISTERSGGVSRYSVAYDVDGTSTVTDPLNTARIFGSQTVQDVPRHTSVNQPCDYCGLASSISYDTSGYLSGATNFNGIAFTYVHDARGLETSRTEASGTPQERTITTQWHPSFRLPTLVTEPGRTKSFDYDASGNLLTRTLTDTAVSLSRTWTHTYNSAGQVLSVNDPRTDVADVTTYAYDSVTGDLATVTNAAGHVTSITAYNAHGQPLTIVDANALTTTLVYDARLRLTSRTVGSESTSYEYDGVGQLIKVTLPDGSFLSYTYDAAHRLTDITDALGNNIHYTLDAMGNRTQEQVRDPLGTLAQTRSRVYNSLNRLFQEIGAQSQTTQYGYDNQGNVTSVDGSLAGTGDTTTNAYDALNRLRQVTDPGLGVTQYAYDGLDALTSVTDPRNLSTSYAVDGLGNLTLQQSPDTGNTANTYDPAGNLLTQTDAKGQTTNYAYDVLNRVTLITFHDGSKQAYAYDQGANGLGRLSSITETDPGNQVTNVIAYAYDAHGRVMSETRTLGGQSYVTAYSYDSFGRMDGMTYPSGRTVAYSFDALGRVSQVSTTKPGDSPQAVAQNVSYHPFGGVTGFTFGNGQVYSRSVDQDGRIASYSLGAQSYGIGYDAASRIEFISEVGNPPNTNTYGYDALDRLTQAVLPNANFAYSYDAVGNRVTKTTGASTDTYAYEATSNRIASVTPGSGPFRSFSFDAKGSTLADGLNTYAHDTRGRMVQAVSSLGATAYQVNALGQRVRKTNSLGDTIFHYDTRGRLIAESEPGGAVKRELIYLGDIPVGVAQ